MGGVVVGLVGGGGGGGGWRGVGVGGGGIGGGGGWGTGVVDLKKGSNMDFARPFLEDLPETLWWVLC